MPRRGQAAADGRLAGKASVEAEAKKLGEAMLRKKRREDAAATLAEAKEALSDEEIKALLRPTKEELLNFRAAVMAGERNSIAISSGMRVMLEYTLEKPEQRVGVEAVQVVVNALPPAREVVAAPALPEAEKEQPN